jgi:hypothetical protein
MADKPELPGDPMSEVMAGFIAMHEMFKYFLAAGFSEDQALRLVAYTTASANRPQGTE